MGTDVDFAGRAQTLQSSTGTILYYKGCPLVCSSKRQSIRATSTCEAEYVAMYDAIRLTMNQGYLDCFQETGELPLLFSDNQSALVLADSSLITKRSKHVQLRFHMVRDHVRSLCYCPTDLNKADPLTKPLMSSKDLSLFHTDLNSSPFAKEALSWTDDEEDGDEAADDVGRCCYIFC